uniref:Uncharacterized protein n=1 Tax=Oryza rufipogon TaxID=4529 RepID=A0A0E0PF77_ORYRU
MVTRWSEKGPGLKILWIWTLGTAGIMITNVVRTRVNDMQKILQEEDEAAAAAAPMASGEQRLYLSKFPEPRCCAKLTRSFALAACRCSIASWLFERSKRWACGM